MSEFHLPESLANLFGKKKPTETSAEPAVENQLQVTTSQGEEKKFDVIYEKGAEPVTAASLNNLAEPVEVDAPESAAAAAPTVDEEMAEAREKSFEEGYTEAGSDYNPGVVDTASSPAIVVPEEPPVSSTVEEVVSSSKTTDEKMTKYDEKAERQGWDLEEYERIKGEIVQLKEMRKKVNDSYLSQSDREYINQRWEHYQELQKNTKGNGLAQFELVFIRARVKALHEYMENESSWNWRWSGKKAVDETDTVKKTAIEQARIDRLHLILKDHTATFTEESWTDSLALYTNEKFNFAAADKDLAASRNALKALLRDKDGFELDQDVVTKISQLFFARKNNKYREGIAPRDDIYPSDGITPDLAISPEPDDDIWTLPAKPDFGTLPTSEDQEETHAILLDLARKLRDRKAAEEKQRLQAKQDQPQPHLPEPAKSEEPTQPPSPEPTTEAIESRNLRDLQCDPIIRVNDRGEQWVVFNKTDGKRHNYLKNGLKKALASAVEEGGSWKLTYENLPTKLELIVAPEQKSKLEETIQNFEAQKGASKLPFIDEILKSSEFKGLFTKTADEIFTGELLALLTEVNADNAQDKRIQLLDALYHHPTVGTEFKNILHSKMRVIQLNAFMDKVYGSESGKDAVVNWNQDGSMNVYKAAENKQAFEAEWAKVPQLNRAQRLFARMRNVFTNQGVPRAGETTFEESVVGMAASGESGTPHNERKKLNKWHKRSLALLAALMLTGGAVGLAQRDRRGSNENDSASTTTVTSESGTDSDSAVVEPDAQGEVPKEVQDAYDSLSTEEIAQVVNQLKAEAETWNRQHPGEQLPDILEMAKKFEAGSLGVGESERFVRLVQQAIVNSGDASTALTWENIEQKLRESNVEQSTVDEIAHVLVRLDAEAIGWERSHPGEPLPPSLAMVHQFVDGQLGIPESYTLVGLAGKISVKDVDAHAEEVRQALDEALLSDSSESNEKLSDAQINQISQQVAESVKRASTSEEIDAGIAQQQKEQSAVMEKANELLSQIAQDTEKYGGNAPYVAEVIRNFGGDSGEELLKMIGPEKLSVWENLPEKIDALLDSVDNKLEKGDPLESLSPARRILWELSRGTINASNSEVVAELADNLGKRDLSEFSNPDAVFGATNRELSIKNQDYLVTYLSQLSGQQRVDYLSYLLDGSNLPDGGFDTLIDWLGFTNVQGERGNSQDLLAWFQEFKVATENKIDEKVNELRARLGTLEASPDYATNVNKLVQPTSNS